MNMIKRSFDKLKAAAAASVAKITAIVKPAIDAAADAAQATEKYFHITGHTRHSRKSGPGRIHKQGTGMRVIDGMLRWRPRSKRVCFGPAYTPPARLDSYGRAELRRSAWARRMMKALDDSDAIVA